MIDRYLSLKMKKNIHQSSTIAEYTHKNNSFIIYLTIRKIRADASSQIPMDLYLGNV